MKREDPFQSAHGPLRLGGSELFLTFFDLAIRHGVKRLEVVSPYIDDAAFADPSLRSAWNQILATAVTTVVVRDAASAAAVVHAMPPRTGGGVRVMMHDRLHMKLFIARCSEARFALAGSLNLTGAALHRNEELGLLLRSSASPTSSEPIGRLCAMAEAIKTDARTIHRSTHGSAYPPVAGGKRAFGRRTMGRDAAAGMSQVPATARNISFGTNDALNTPCASNVVEEIP